MIWKKRMIGILIFFICIFLILIGRLAQIQIISTESFSGRHVNLLEKSVEQRTHALVLDDGRGRFSDRDGKALTDDYRPSLILFPFLKRIDWPAQKVARVLDVSEQELLRQIKDSNNPFIFRAEGMAVRLTKQQLKDINALGIPGVVAANTRIKGEHPLAEHLLGLTGQNEAELKKRYGELLQQGKISSNTLIGISGLQQAFDEFLLTDGEAKLLYHVDRQGEPIFGKHVKYTYPANPFYPVVIKTTIAKDLQQGAEEVIAQHGIQKGGLVLLDVKTNEILAMVSKPSLSTANPRAYQQGAVNYMLTLQFPGSVFKTVIAAAAIDKGIVEQGRMFDCNRNPYGVGVADRPMGQLSLEESFARSCNRTFADLGQELLQQDKDAIENYARMLGLEKTVGWAGDVFHFPRFRQLPEEEEGIIWRDEADKTVSKAIAQTAIGQKDVRLSPLAVANMMATIARGGKKLEVKAVQEIQYKNGAKLYRFPEHEQEGETLRAETIHELQQLLRYVVSNPKGTGAIYQSLPLTVSGKSGTAQTGKDDSVNRWFAGYFPADHPRYVLVVVDIETKSPMNAVNAIFADYVRTIAAWERSGGSEVR